MKTGLHFIRDETSALESKIAIFSTQSGSKNDGDETGRKQWKIAVFIIVGI